MSEGRHDPIVDRSTRLPHHGLPGRRHAAELAAATLLLALVAAAPAQAANATQATASTPPSPTFTTGTEREHGDAHPHPATPSQSATATPATAGRGGHGGHEESLPGQMESSGSAVDDHAGGDDAGGDHAGHDDGAPAVATQRPRALVLGSFAGVNGLVLLAAAVARRRGARTRRDRARSARRTANPTATTPARPATKDLSLS